MHLKLARIYANARIILRLDKSILLNVRDKDTKRGIPSARVASYFADKPL